MRLLVMVFALLLAFAATAMAVEVCPPGTEPVVTGAGPLPTLQLTGDEAFDSCLIRSLGITNQQLCAYRAQGLTNADLAIASAIARQSKQPIDLVVAQYKLTPGWENVAQYYRVTYSDLSIPADLMNPDNNVFNAAFISQQYGTSVADIQALKSQGFSWGEINLISNASIRTGLSVQQVAALRNQGVSWQDMATRYNLSVTSLTLPCPTMVPRLSCCAALAAGPVCTRPVAPVIYTKGGNVLLTEEEAFRYYSRGYDWMEVAIAANIARETGYPIDQVLIDMRSGALWEQTAALYGVSPATAFDLSGYPFGRRSIYSSGMQIKNMQRLERFQTSPNVFGPTPYSQPALPGAAAPQPMVPGAAVPQPVAAPQPVVPGAAAPQPVY